ncbi:MAG: hypothetical protein GY788_25550 [bacterium]|nr:hypothetical protein [bacterium]
MSARLKLAVDDGILARDATSGVKVPTVRRREQRFLTAEQVTALATAAENAQTGAGLVVEILTWIGMQWVELVALRRPRVHMLRRRIEIAESATELGSGLATRHDANVPRRSSRHHRRRRPRIHRAERRAAPVLPISSERVGPCLGGSKSRPAPNPRPARHRSVADDLHRSQHQSSAAPALPRPERAPKGSGAVVELDGRTRNTLT